MNCHITIVVVLLFASKLFAHGNLPINVHLENDFQLVIDSEFESGPFTRFDGQVFSDLPGVSVARPTNGVSNGTVLGVDVLSGLLYSDGIDVGRTSTELRMIAPTIDGTGQAIQSPVESYLITHDSGFQTGMQWGAYRAIPGWDAHGMFQLSELDSPIGVYGLVLQITSPGLLPTDPFLVPFAFDPTGLGELTAEEYESAISAMNQFIVNRPTFLQAGDANQDLSFDESDLVKVFQAGKYGKDIPATWGEGDWNGAPGGRVGLPPIGDGRFDESDLLFAYQNGLFGTGNYHDNRPQFVTVPESAPWAFLFTAFIPFHQRRSRNASQS